MAIFNSMTPDNEQSLLVAKKLKEYFFEQKLTQKSISDILGLSQATVSGLLRGKPFGRKTAELWAEKFGFNISWLLAGQGSMFPGGDVTEKKLPVEKSSKGINLSLILESNNKMASAVEKISQSNKTLSESNRELIIIISELSRNNVFALEHIERIMESTG